MSVMQRQLTRSSCSPKGSISISPADNRRIISLLTRFASLSNPERSHRKKQTKWAMKQQCVLPKENTLSLLPPTLTKPTYTTTSFIIPPRWTVPESSKTFSFQVWRFRKSVTLYVRNMDFPSSHRSLTGRDRKELSTLRSEPSVTICAMPLTKCFRRNRGTMPTS